MYVIMNIKIISVKAIGPWTPMPSSPASWVIESRAPPSASTISVSTISISISIPISKTKTYTKPARTISPTETPSEIWCISEIKSPGPGSWIIISAIPWLVVIPRTINNGRSINITIQISGRISHISIIRIYIIDIYIFGIVYRYIGWDQVDIYRPHSTYNKGSGRVIRNKPNAIINHIKPAISTIT
jgi:hypothetical protein